MSTDTFFLFYVDSVVRNDSTADCDGRKKHTPATNNTEVRFFALKSKKKKVLDRGQNGFNVKTTTTTRNTTIETRKRHYQLLHTGKSTTDPDKKKTTAATYWKQYN